MSDNTYYNARTLDDIKEMLKNKNKDIQMARADYNALTAEELRELHSLGVKLDFRQQTKEEYEALKEREKQ